jgi:hypothetical protein
MDYDNCLGIDGAKTICAPVITNDLEAEYYYGNSSKRGMSQDFECRFYLNDDCTWTLRKDTGPADRVTIKGMKSKKVLIPDNLLPPPDVIVIPNFTGPYGRTIHRPKCSPGCPIIDELYKDIPAGYPKDTYCASFGYCPPESETPVGYNIRCVLRRAMDFPSPPPGHG